MCESIDGLINVSEETAKELGSASKHQCNAHDRDGDFDSQSLGCSKNGLAVLRVRARISSPTLR